MKKEKKNTIIPIIVNGLNSKSITNHNLQVHFWNVCLRRQKTTHRYIYHTLQNKNSRPTLLDLEIILKALIKAKRGERRQWRNFSFRYRCMGGKPKRFIILGKPIYSQVGGENSIHSNAAGRIEPGYQMWKGGKTPPPIWPQFE